MSEWVCNYCNTVFASEGEVITHQINWHKIDIPPPAPSFCEKCRELKAEVKGWKMRVDEAAEKVEEYQAKVERLRAREAKWRELWDILKRNDIEFTFYGDYDANAFKLLCSELMEQGGKDEKE